jgi:hypothetical protein
MELNGQQSDSLHIILKKAKDLYDLKRNQSIHIILK